MFNPSSRIGGGKFEYCCECRYANKTACAPSRFITANPINIGGWYISDSPGDSTKYRIAAGTILPANGYLVFTELDQFGNAAAPGALVPFAFNDTGDDAILSSANAFGVLSGYDHEIHFDASDPQVTLGRYTNSGGSAFAAVRLYTASG